MKCLVLLLISSLLLVACNDTTNDKPEVDTHSSSDISRSERNKQIDGARNNRALLPGKWEVTDARNEDEQLTKVALSELNFQKINFYATDSFSVYHKNKLLDAGQYEWMAEDRELVLTSGEGTVQRMLVKKISQQYLKLKFNGIYLTFKKVNE